MKESKLYKVHPDIDRLKAGDITKVLAEGLAMVCHQQPEFPINYLANFLLSHCRTTAQSHQLHQLRNHKANLIEEDNLTREAHRKQLEDQQRENFKIQHRDVQFKNELSKQADNYAFLNKFCGWLESRFDLAGVYVGQHKNPKRGVSDSEMGEMAHLNSQQPKRIEYIAASEGQRLFTIGKSISAESLTGSLFQPKQEEAGNAEEEGEKEKDQGYIYVPNVIREERITYLRYPRLGSYLCIPLFYKSYLNSHSFEVGLEETLKYNKAREEFDKEMEKREAEFRQVYDEKARNDADEHELEQMELKFKEEKNALSPPEVEIPSEEIQLVVCGDTLGLDREIPEQTRSLMVQYVGLLKTNWEAKELQMVKEDIENQTRYLQLLEAPVQEVVQKALEADDKEPQDLSDYERFKNNEKEYNYEIESFKLDKLKDSFGDEKYLAYFNCLTSMHVLKHRPIMQMALYFLGYKKEDINVPDTNMLDWEKVRSTLCNQGMIERLIEYTHRGEKNQQTEPYSKWVKILSVLEKFDVEAVMSYNLFYGKLLKYMLLTGKLRKVDKQLREERLRGLRAGRLEKIAENRRLGEEKERVKEEQTAAAEGKEDQPAFDVESWEAQYNEEHPLLQVESEYGEEVDNDLEQQGEGEVNVV